MEILKLEQQDIHHFIALVHVFEDVFEMEPFAIPDTEYLQALLAKPDFMAFAALEQNTVVGGLTAYVLHQYYSVMPLVYIYDLAVKRDFQRQGIGSRLIQSVTDYCQQRGFEEVFVQADKVDDYALDFYRSTGATEEQVVHFYYPLHPKNT
ncbi:GNAT family N-acetyltransferase [Pontibacter roseus]|uniref:GNAT family N-acetyltransferase n=1 Tax=Pontibacter roseus TaxID=336989 RepID=UPI0003829265|nr:GNAT family N-acetyltransferase [Pontibacter roseus]